MEKREKGGPNYGLLRRKRTHFLMKRSLSFRFCFFKNNKRSSSGSVDVKESPPTCICFSPDRLPDVPRARHIGARAGVLG